MYEFTVGIVKMRGIDINSVVIAHIPKTYHHGEIVGFMFGKAKNLGIDRKVAFSTFKRICQHGVTYYSIFPLYRIYRTDFFYFPTGYAKDQNDGHDEKSFHSKQVIVEVFGLNIQLY
jgi:hypothetical protein